MWEGPEICAGGLYCLLSTDGLKHETVPPPTYLARHHAQLYTTFTTARMRATLQLPAIEVIVIMHVMRLLVQSPGIWRHAIWDLNPGSQ